MSWEIIYSDNPDPLARQQNIRRCIESLVHVCQCSDANCLPSCQRMKRVVMHEKACKRKFDCPICKHLVAICSYHAKHCQEAKCSVLYCSNIKIIQQRKLVQQQQLQQQQVQQQQQQVQQQQQQVQQQRQQQQMLCQRMAAMKMSPPPANPAQHAPQLKQLPRSVVPSQQQQRKALQQLVATLRSPASHNQHQEIQRILKSNPVLVVALLKQGTQAVNGVFFGHVDLEILSVGVVGNVYLGVGDLNLDVRLFGVQLQTQVRSVSGVRGVTGVRGVAGVRLDGVRSVATARLGGVRGVPGVVQAEAAL